MVRAATEYNLNSTEDFYKALRALEERFDSLEPEFEVTVRDPELGVEGYVVVWNTKISEGGPLSACGKGGTRIVNTLNLDEIKMLARTMALKNAAAGLPLGGAKSGIKIDPSDPDLEKKYRRFAKLCAPFLHENGGPFGGFGFDLGGAPEHARWVCDELKSSRCFTGKTVDMGGTDYDNEGIAGLGVATAAKALINLRGEKVKDMRFAVQGAGAMGAAVLRYFEEYGGKLAYIADPKFGGTWQFKNGISESLRNALIVHDFSRIDEFLKIEGVNISDRTQDVLFQDVDVLFPCAIQNVITETNSVDIKARYISEGANQPVTKEAYPALLEKGIFIIPDFIANPGGVIAAFVELTSKSDNKVQEAKDYTVKKITKNVGKMQEIIDQYGVGPVDAGKYLALNNIFYGIQP